MEGAGERAFGRYILERRLAVGGMAEIHLARQEGPAGFSRRMVVKRILSHLADQDDFVAMFLDEARLAARLAHPNIVQIFDFGEVEGDYFLAMELVRGPDLRRLRAAMQAAGGAMPFTMIARICAAVAEGLEYAHRLTDEDGQPLQIIHRDVSPSNILLSYDGVPKIVDFGIARAASRTHQTQAGMVKGKFAYMAPEQVLGRPTDGRLDVYALGVVLFEMVTSRLPFTADSDVALMRAVVDERVPPARQFNPDVPAELERIILTATAHDAAQRYASARAMAGDLDRFVLSHGGPVNAFDISGWLATLADHLGDTLDGLGPPRPPTGAKAPASEQKAPARTRRPHITAPGTPDPASAEGRQMHEDSTAYAQGAPPPPEVPVEEQRTQLRAPLAGRAVDPPPAYDGPTDLEAPRVAIESEHLVTDDLEPLEAIGDDDVSAAFGSRRRILWLGSGAGVIVAGLLVFLAFRGPEAPDTSPKPLAPPQGAEQATAQEIVKATPSAEPAPEEAGGPAPEEAAGPAPEEAAGPASEEAAEPAPEEAAGPAPEPPAVEKRAVAAAEPRKPRSAGPQVQPKPVRASTPSAAATGFALVKATPWADLYLGGRKLGTTPARISLPAGRHRLTLKNDELGFETPLDVDIAADGVARYDVKIPPGKVAVLVKPWGEVWVDGQRKGETPLPPISLAPGDHQVEVRHPETGKSVKKVVRVLSGTQSTLRFDLTAE